MTVKELIKILEEYKDTEKEIYLRDSDGDLNTLWDSNISLDKDGDIIFSVRW